MKTAVVTGATSGIGLAVCAELAALGFAVVGVGQSEERCASAASGLAAAYPDVPILFFRADLSRQAEVARVGGEIREYLEDRRFGRLEALINNAGCVRGRYTTTEDGYETVFAVNHLAGFMLSGMLMPCLISAKGRILMTSSGSHKGTRPRWSDMMLKRGYNPLFAYKQSKLCNLLFAYGLNERFGKLGISAYGIDPGLVKTDIGFKNAGGIVALVWKLRHRRGVPPELPAKIYARVCLEAEAPKGLYYGMSGEEKYSRQVNKRNADRLWELSERLCGMKLGADEK